MTRIYLIAGEASGDFIGAKLIEALREVCPDVELVGVGGPQMTSHGFQSLFPMHELSVMGIAEILPRLPRLLSRISQTVADIKSRKPDIVVTIDAPDFSFRVERSVRKSMPNPPKLIHYVAPTVWAWREGRAAKIARFLDGLICLFDFEPPYFEKHGLKSIAVGHPMVEGNALRADGDRFRSAQGISKSETVVGVLFGSRKGELKRTGIVIRDAVFHLAQKMTSLPRLVVPTLPYLKDDVAALLREYPGEVLIVTDPEEKWNAFTSLDIAIAVSGTVGLELAALEVPHVIAYKASPITAMVVRMLIKVKFVHLANLLIGREVVPEFIQEKAVSREIGEKAFTLLMDPSAQKDAFKSIRYKIGADQEKTPSQKAAAFVLSFLK